MICVWCNLFVPLNPVPLNMYMPFNYINNHSTVMSAHQNIEGRKISVMVVSIFLVDSFFLDFKIRVSDFA